MKLLLSEVSATTPNEMAMYSIDCPNAQPTKQFSCTLHKLPPEIRIMIYALVLEVRTSLNLPKPEDMFEAFSYPTVGRPPFLVALRMDCILYAETLQTYYEINKFEITAENRYLWTFKILPALTPTESFGVSLGSANFESLQRNGLRSLRTNFGIVPR